MSRGDSKSEHLIWCEVSRTALIGNINEFKKIAGRSVRLAAVVKANAYGHGLIQASRCFVEAGVDGLCVNDVLEGEALRADGVEIPIYVLGYVSEGLAERAVKGDLIPVVYGRKTVDALDRAGRAAGKIAKAHLKVDTGTNRQGLRLEDLLELAKYAASRKNIVIDGLSTHFADIEDTTDHSYAKVQIEAYIEAVSRLKEMGIDPPVKNIANSAATILWPEAHFNMVRLGISAYGLWPSKETLISARMLHRENINLTPALTWKTRIAQVRRLSKGEYIGYGRTFRTAHETLLAVCPVGYYDGYDRNLSNTGYVLINGARAQVRGRVCMNMIMADVTDAPDAKEGDEVILMGRADGDSITPEQFASWAGTINYEAVARINDRIPRIIVE
ncbi:MAG: alanine racemase [Deltaproteobacteria bacterium]|nr:alanine racemase [Deltaproteobacteria bacterium]